MQKIVAGLNTQSEGRQVPVILFTKGGGQWLSAMADTGCNCLGLDWTTNIGVARQLVGERVALQGNMDPSVLRGSDSSIEAEAKTILASFGNNPGHIFNLGHGITPDINPDKVKVLVDAVQTHSAK
jgi:uroporphyrinogen decarboxylase